ncbi:MAG: hypothetical protein MI923_08790 [Phycisphaerales bacterium]|nr:hypothetical protein [Phycisphaerales bacterium]
MKDGFFDFESSVFFKVLAATLGILFLGWLASIWIYGELTRTDMIGSLISAPIFAYLVHLWIIYAKESGD